MTASSEPERRWLRATWSPEPGTRPRQQLPLLGLPLDPVWPPRASPGSALHIALTLPGPRPPPSAPSPQPLSGPRPPAFPSFVHSGHQEGWAPLLFLPHTKEAKSLHFLDLQVPNWFSEVLQLITSSGSHSLPSPKSSNWIQIAFLPWGDTSGLEAWRKMPAVLLPNLSPRSWG